MIALIDSEYEIPVSLVLQSLMIMSVAKERHSDSVGNALY